jgi:hypothetical protein
MDDFQKMKHALTRVEGGKIKAVTDGDKVFLFIQNAPDELRKLADALEQLNISDVSALVAYTNAKVRESQRATAIDAPLKPKDEDS